MMYLALSYDHRVVDGCWAIVFCTAPPVSSEKSASNCDPRCSVILSDAKDLARSAYWQTPDAGASVEILRCGSLRSE
jgi:hypothetical protein